MTVSLVQSAEGQTDNTTATVTVTLPATPTASNVLVAWVMVRSLASSIATPSGWTLVDGCTTNADNGCRGAMFYRVVAPSDPAAWSFTTSANYKHATVVELGPCTFDASVAASNQGYPSAGTFSTPLGPATATADGIAIAGYAGAINGLGTATFTPGAGWAELEQGQPFSSNAAFAQSADTTAGSVSSAATLGGGNDESYGGVLALFAAPAVIIDPGEPPDYVSPPPGGAILEIWAALPGAARWGVAHWGEDVWAAAGWVDVTPQGIDVEINWGTRRPENGILAQPDAATWAVDTFDPERILDPANEEGPYWGDLLPGLPIRLSHGSTVVRRGHVEVIGYAYGTETGYIRATDRIATLAGAKVPADTVLPDTLRARARAIVDALALDVPVEADPPGSTDPPVTARLEGDSWTAWGHIWDAAQQALYIPWVDRYGTLRFRAYDTPLVRGRDLSAPELVDLTAIATFDGLYSEISVQPEDPDADPVIRRLTPAPRYGRRTYERLNPTLEPEAWADAVLLDRATPSLAWEPGVVRPLDAASVELFATIEAGEDVTISDTHVDPAVLAGGKVLGGTITVVGRIHQDADWSFVFGVAAAPVPPLFSDDADPPEALTSEAGDEYLYPG